MSSLAELQDLVGFFSYSRRDDEHSGGALSRLRARIHDELRLQLGRDLRLWQDTAAIPHGTQWSEEIKAAIAESAFFIPIVTPSAVASEHCQHEFRAFVEREGVLGRADLVFPILYIKVPALLDDAKVRENAVLEMVHSRQYADWTKIRLQEVGAFEVARQIERMCEDIVTALERRWIAPAKPRQRPPVEVVATPSDQDEGGSAQAPPEDRAPAGADEVPAGETAVEETRRRDARVEQEARAEQERVERARVEREDAERVEQERVEHERAAKERAEVGRAFALARRANTVLGIDVFLAAHPDSHLAGEAGALRAALEVRDRAYAAAVAKGGRAALNAFLKTYPGAVQADEVRQRLRKLGRPRALVAGLAALAAVAVVAIGAVVSWLAFRTDDLAICTKADRGDAMAACTRVIQDASALPARRAVAYGSRGAMYGSQHQNDQAVVDFTEALKLDPNSVTAYLKRGGVYESEGSYDHAIADLTAATRLDAKNAPAYELRGDAYVEQRKYDQAIDDYTRVLTLDPGSASAHRKRAGAYTVKGDADHAVADLGEAIRLDPKNAEAYALRAEANFNAKKYDATIADADQALKLDSKSTVARLNRGKAYQVKGNNDQAIADLTEMARSSEAARTPAQIWTTASFAPNSRLAEAYLYRGMAYKAKNDDDNAIADYTTASQLDPTDIRAYAYRAYAYTAKNAYDRAIADWTRVIAIMPQRAFLYHERGTDYFAKKDYDPAIADFSDAIRLDPDDADNYFGRAKARQAKGDYAHAVTDYSEVIRRDSRNGQAYRFRGASYYFMKDYDHAVPDFNEAVRLDPKDGLAYLGRGLAKQAKGDNDGGNADIAAARKLGASLGE